MSPTVGETVERARAAWFRGRARGSHVIRSSARRRPSAPRDERFADPADAAAMLERILVDNIIPFWSQVVDEEHGGFRLHHDQAGRWSGPAPSHLVAQARTTWYFARLSRSPWGTPDDLERARHGAAFLRDAHLDDRHGGYHWTVEPSGQRPIEPAKLLYGQAFALYAFSELAAAGDLDAGAAATELVELLERHGRDRRRGGYLEFLAADWSTPARHVPDPRKGTPSDWKTRDTHLHLLEAFGAYRGVPDGLPVDDVLRELVTALTVSFRSPLSGVLVEHRTASWEPPGTRRDEVVSYGHDLEAVWLLDDVVRRLGDPPELLLSHHLDAFDQTLRHGLERRRAGVSYSGRPHVTGGRRVRSWWVQAEALVGCLAMARLTGEQRYVDTFSSILGWIVDHQVDWERGEWFEWVTPGGHARGVKASAFKGPYHSGRAMLECLERIPTLPRAAGGSAAR